MRIAIHTLGCKINQYESELLQLDLAARGNCIVPFDEHADVYVVNTCTVTAKSDQACRNAIRSAVRRNQIAKVFVTGCYAETQPEELKKIPGVSAVIGNRFKETLADQIAGTDASSTPAKPDKSLRTRTRGFLKIQDGCDNRCSYCIVPSARGGPKSALPEFIIEEFDQLIRTECPEIVLTGIHIGKYGVDLEQGINLTAIIRLLLARRGSSRIRISSIEPREVTGEIIGFLGSGLCRHLHIPLQSGDDNILASMNRNYTADFYVHLLESLIKGVPGIAVGSDVMVGYPGEGDTEFQNTVRLIENVPLTHLHVFSYSPRPGTPAAAMKQQISEVIKKQRSELLREIARKKNYEFRKNQVGCELQVVVENKLDRTTELMTGITDNYIRLNIIGSKRADIGRIVNVKIENAEMGLTTAVLI